MKIINKSTCFCPFCMKEHELITTEEMNITYFKGIPVESLHEFEYCEITEEAFTTEKQSTANSNRIKDVYRAQTGLLTSSEIKEIREHYGIAQEALANLLGWGGKTITRYEGPQVQDRAHDDILRKLRDDPAWFIDLLVRSKEEVPEEQYEKYLSNALKLYGEKEDLYLRKAIQAQYSQYTLEDAGNSFLNFENIISCFNFFSNEVPNLFKVKLMKLLWYADSLSFKRYGHSITGMVYYAEAMGAVPVAHDAMMALDGITYEAIEHEHGIGYKFHPNPDAPCSLNPDEIDILKTVVEKFGRFSRHDLVEYMHKEKAYQETPIGDVLSFEYAKDLSID